MLGPHFYYDLIRLARRGWPTGVRVLYLVALLLSLTIIHQTQRQHVTYQQLAQQAERGFQYAMTLIVLQDVLILLLLPVYVAGAVVEDKENRTIESLFLTDLADHEIALSKLGARLMPLAALVLAGFPVLAFLHLYGNLGTGLLVYHETNSLLLLLAGGSICLGSSTRSETVFQAISNAYPLMLLLALAGILGAALLPWLIGVPIAMLQHAIWRTPLQPVPWYAISIVIVAPIYVTITAVQLIASVRGMERFRLSESRRPRRLTGGAGADRHSRADAAGPAQALGPFAHPSAGADCARQRAVLEGMSQGRHHLQSHAALAVPGHRHCAGRGGRLSSRGAVQPGSGATGTDGHGRRRRL